MGAHGTIQFTRANTEAASLAPSVEGWSRCAEGQAYCAASGRVAQHSEQTNHHEQRKHSAARSSTDRPTTWGTLLQVAAQCSVLSGRRSLLYGALRELSSTLATSLPPLFLSPLVGPDAALPGPDRTHPPSPLPPAHPAALFPCVARYSVIRLCSPICSSFCHSRTRTRPPAALSLPPCLINR
jgi:hypothetical protein